jgi:hypothetical protein
MLSLFIYIWLIYKGYIIQLMYFNCGFKKEHEKIVFFLGMKIMEFWRG